MAQPPIDKKYSAILPPLLETFPAETYPLREIGTGFTAQSAQGDDANACAGIAAEMLCEARGAAYSAASSEGGSSCHMMDAEPFIVPDLPLPDDAAKVWCVCVCLCVRSGVVGACVFVLCVCLSGVVEFSSACRACVGGLYRLPLRKSTFGSNAQILCS